ncbi:hypothetical protein OIO90_002185 [Microbotryomycetes sp. JL221]|nr:hypothetical protein OIO90_002185 [Microbotryomycetes sp. JL221]
MDMAADVPLRARSTPTAQEILPSTTQVQFPALFDRTTDAVSPNFVEPNDLDGLAFLRQTPEAASVQTEPAMLPITLPDVERERHGRGHQRRTSLAQALAEEWRAAVRAAEQDQQQATIDSPTSRTTSPTRRITRSSNSPMSASRSHSRQSSGVVPLSPFVLNSGLPNRDATRTISDAPDSVGPPLSPTDFAACVNQRFDQITPTSEHHPSTKEDISSGGTSVINDTMRSAALDAWLPIVDNSKTVVRRLSGLALDIPPRPAVNDSLATPTMPSPIETPTTTQAQNLHASPVHTISRLIVEPNDVTGEPKLVDTEIASLLSPLTSVDNATPETTHLTISDGESDEDDADSHPLYALLSTSPSPPLRRIWDSSTLILVPPRRVMPGLDPLTTSMPARVSPGSPGSGFEFVRGAKGVNGEQAGRNADQERQALQQMRDRLEKWISWHAFRPMPGLPGVWRSVGGGVDSGFIRLTLHSETGEAHVDWIGTQFISMSEDSMPLPALSRSARSTDSQTSSSIIQTPSTHDIALPSVLISSRSNVNSSLVNDRPDYQVGTGSTLQRRLRMKSETTVYRRPRPPSPVRLGPQAVSQTPRQARSGFRAPKWLRRAGFQVGSPGSSVATSGRLRTLEEGKVSNSAPAASTTQAPLQRVRVIQVDQSPAFSDWVGVTHCERATDLDLTVTRSRTTSSSISRGSSATSPVNTPRNTQSSDHHTKDNSRPLGMTLTSSRAHSSQVSLLSVRRLASWEPPPPFSRARTNSIASVRSFASGRSAVAAMNTTADIATGRSFIRDLAFLTTPPSHLQELTGAFSATLVVIRTLVLDFESSYAYIKGFDAYTVQRIRKGIYDKAWQQLQRSLTDSGELGMRLLKEENRTMQSLTENVIFGFLHTKLYVSSIAPLFEPEDVLVNHILTLYRAESLAPAQLGVDLCDLGEGRALDSASHVLQLLDAASPEPSIPTPLDCISIMHETIESIVQAVTEVDSTLRVTPDDLIPLLAYVIVKSNMRDLESLMHYAKTYRLHADLAPKLDWSFVTFQAAVAFVCSDPLGMLDDHPIPISHDRSIDFDSLPASRPSLPRPQSLYLQHSQDTKSPPASPGTSSTIAFLPTNSARAKTTLAHSRLGNLGSVASSAESSGSGSSHYHRRHQRTSDEWSRRVSTATPDTDVSEMPPPSWIKAPWPPRRQSVPNGDLSSVTNDEWRRHPTQELGSAAVHLRAMSSTSSWQSRPRPKHRPHSVSVDWAIMPPRWSSSSSNLPELYDLDRGSASNSLASADMRRSESEGSPTVKRSPAAPTWSTWSSSDAPFPRVDGPINRSLTNATSMSGHTNSSRPSFDRRMSSTSGSGGSVSGAGGDNASCYQKVRASVDEDSWRSLAEKASPSITGHSTPRTAIANTTQQFTATTMLSSLESDFRDISALSVRPRRLSASAADGLHLRRSMLSPANRANEPPLATSARLVALLSDRPQYDALARQNAYGSQRPRSVVSVASVSSSFESGPSKSTCDELGTLNATSAVDGETSTQRDRPRRKTTKSMTWRDLPTANLVGKALA